MVATAALCAGIVETRPESVGVARRGYASATRPRASLAARSEHGGVNGGPGQRHPHPRVLWHTHSLIGRCPTPTCCTTRWSSTARRRAVPISPLIPMVLLVLFALLALMVVMVRVLLYFYYTYGCYGSYSTRGSYGSFYPLIRVVGIRFDPLLFAALCWGPTSKCRHPPWGFSPRIRCVATEPGPLPAVLRSPIPHRATCKVQHATCAYTAQPYCA